MARKIAILFVVFVLVAPIICEIEQRSVEISFSKQVVQKELPLKGEWSKLYMYYATVNIGSPPVPFTVTTDTGSSDFIIPQAGCQGCIFGDPSKYYNSTLSSTSAPIKCDDPRFTCQSCYKGQCATSVDYGGQILEQEVLFEDVIDIAGLKTNVVFGAVYNVTFGENADEYSYRFQSVSPRDGPYPDMPEGMLGLAYSSLVSSGYLPVFDSLVHSGLVNNIFSMCLTENGGQMVLGGIGQYHTGDLQWTPVTAESFYNVHMMDIMMNGISIGVPEKIYNEKYSIIDSGTPAPTFPQPVLDALRKSFLSLCSGTKLHGMCDVPTNETFLDSVCYQLTPAQIAQYPTLEFVLKGEVHLKWEAQYYLAMQPYCNPGEVGIFITSPGDDFTVLGAEVLQRFNVVHDRANKRIGFGNVSGCPSH